MPDPIKKITYKVGNDKFDIDPSQKDEFLKDFPNAQELLSFKVDKDTFDIEPSQRDEFLRDFPNAVPTFAEGEKKNPVGSFSQSGSQGLQGGTPSAQRPIPSKPLAGLGGENVITPRLITEPKPLAQYKPIKQLPTGEKFVEKDFFGGNFGAMLKSIDAATPLGLGEFIDDIGRSISSGYKQGQSTDETLLIMAKGRNINENDLQKYMDAVKVAQNQPMSDAMYNFNKSVEEKAARNEGGKADFWDVFTSLNAGVVPEIVLSSFSAMLNPASATAAGGAVAGGAAVGGAVGAVASAPLALAAAGTTLETASTFNELLQKEIESDGKEFTKDNVRTILEDPKRLSQIRSKAAGRGLAIGVVDAITGKLGGAIGAKIAKSGAKGATTLGALATTGTEAVGGSAGEAAGQVVAGQEISPQDIVLEGIGEIGTAPIQFASAISSDMSSLEILSAIRSEREKKKQIDNISGRPSYEINGETVSKETVDEIIDNMPVGGMDGLSVIVDNDRETSDKVASAMKRSEVESNIKKAAPSLSDENVSSIAELQVELDALKGNDTEVAKKRASEIRAQIDVLISGEKQIEKPKKETAPVAEIISIEDRVAEIASNDPEFQTLNKLMEESNKRDLTDEENSLAFDIEKRISEKVNKELTNQEKIDFFKRDDLANIDLPIQLTTENIETPSNLSFLPSEITLVHLSKEKKKISSSKNMNEITEDELYGGGDSRVLGLYMSDSPSWNKGSSSRLPEYKGANRVTIKNEGMLYFDNNIEFDKYLFDKYKSELEKVNNQRDYSKALRELLLKDGVKAILTRTFEGSSNELIVIDPSIIMKSESLENKPSTYNPNIYSGLTKLPSSIDSAKEDLAFKTEQQETAPTKEQIVPVAETTPPQETTASESETNKPVFTVNSQGNIVEGTVRTKRKGTVNILGSDGKIYTRTDSEVFNTKEEAESLSETVKSEKSFAASFDNSEDISKYVEGGSEVTVGDTKMTLIDKGNNVVELNKIKTPKPKRGKGSARKALQELTAKADEQGITLELNVAPEKGTTKEGLVKLYESQGFVADKGDMMRREPKKIETPKTETNAQKQQSEPLRTEGQQEQPKGEGDNNMPKVNRAELQDGKTPKEEVEDIKRLSNKRLTSPQGEINTGKLEEADLPNTVTEENVGKDEYNNLLKVYINNPKLQGTLLARNGRYLFRAMQGRFFVISRVGDFYLPFYISSAGTSGKNEGEWYPFFGYNNWLVKGRVGKNGDMEYSEKISEIQKLLNDNFQIPAKYFTQFGQIIDGKGTPINPNHVFYDINKHVKYESWFVDFDRKSGNKYTEEQFVSDRTGFNPINVVNDGKGSADNWINDIVALIENAKKASNGIISETEHQVASEKTKEEIDEKREDAIYMLRDKLKAIAQKKFSESDEGKTIRLARAYNGMGNRERKSPVGLEIFAELQASVKEAGFILQPQKSGGFTVLNKDGKAISMPKKVLSKERRQEILEERRESEAYRRKILSSEPFSIEQWIAQQVARRRRFSKSDLERYGDIGSIPSWMYSENGISFDDVLENAINDGLGMSYEAEIDPSKIAMEIMSYASRDGDRRAFDFAERMYEIGSNESSYGQYGDYSPTSNDILEYQTLEELPDDVIEAIYDEIASKEEYETSEQYLTDIEKSIGEYDNSRKKEGASQQTGEDSEITSEEKLRKAKERLINAWNAKLNDGSLGIMFDPKKEGQRLADQDKELIDAIVGFTKEYINSFKDKTKVTVNGLKKYFEDLGIPLLKEWAEELISNEGLSDASKKRIIEARKEAASEQKEKYSQKIKDLRKSLNEKFSEYKKELKEKTRSDKAIVSDAKKQMQAAVRDSKIPFSNTQAAKIGRLISDVTPENISDKGTELSEYLGKLVEEQREREQKAAEKKAEKKEAERIKKEEAERKELISEITDNLNVKKYGRKSQRTRKRKKITVTNATIDALRALSDIFFDRIPSMSLEELQELDMIIEAAINTGKINRSNAEKAAKLRRTRVNATGLEMTQRKQDMVSDISGRADVMDQIKPPQGTSGGGNLVILQDGTVLNATVEGRQLADQLPDEAFINAKLVIVPVPRMSAMQFENIFKSISDRFYRASGFVRSRMDFVRLVQAMASTEKDAKWLHDNLILELMKADEKVFSDRKKIRQSVTDLKKKVFGSEKAAVSRLNERSGVNIETTDGKFQSVESLTVDEAIYMYNQAKQSSSIDKMIGAKMTLESILNVIEYVNKDPKLKAYADGLIGIYESYLPTVNSALDAGGYIAIPKVPNAPLKEGLMAMSGESGQTVITTLREELEQAQANLDNNTDEGELPSLDRKLKAAKTKYENAVRDVKLQDIKRSIMEVLYGSVDNIPEFEEYSPRSVSGTDVSVQGPKEFFSTSTYDSANAPSIVSNNLVERQTGGTLNVDSSESLLYKYIDSMPQSVHKMQLYETIWTLFHNSSPVLNSLEKKYGKQFTEALQIRAMDSLTGKSSSISNISDKIGSDAALKWVFYAAGDIMFMNVRSAIFQTLSFSNFIADAMTEYDLGTEYLKHALDVETYKKDRKEIIESGQFYQRVKYSIDPNMRDLIEVRESRGASVFADKILSYIEKAYEMGYAPTKFVDSYITVATAGAPLYSALKERYYNENIKEGMSEENAMSDANERAMAEFWLNANKTQQSSLEPFRSIEQSSRNPFVRMFLTFGSVSLLYTRAMFETVSDMKNGRTSIINGISRLAYYGAIQNVMFFAFQSGLVWLWGSNDEDDEERKKLLRDEKWVSVINDSFNNVVRGLGVYGSMLVFAKDFAMSEVARKMSKDDKEQFEKDYNALKQFVPQYNQKLNAAEKLVKMIPPAEIRLRDISVAVKKMQDPENLDPRGDVDRYWNKAQPYVTALTVTGLPAVRNVQRMVDAMLDIAYDDMTTYQIIGRLTNILTKYDYEKQKPPTEEEMRKRIQQEKKERKENYISNISDVVSKQYGNEYVPSSTSMSDAMEDTPELEKMAEDADMNTYKFKKYISQKAVDMHNAELLRKKDKDMAFIMLTNKGKGDTFGDNTEIAERYYERFGRNELTNSEDDLMSTLIGPNNKMKVNSILSKKQ